MSRQRSPSHTRSCASRGRVIRRRPCSRRRGTGPPCSRPCARGRRSRSSSSSVAISVPPFDLAMSSSASSRFAAATIGSTWSGRRKPTIAPSTAGLRSVQATATAPGRRAVALGDGRQPLDEREVLGELRLLEARVVLAPVVLGQALDPLPGHPAGQQARSPSASRRSRRSPRARRTAGSRPRPRARPASTAAAASRPARSAGSRRSCATSKFETPMWRTRPCSFSSAKAAQPSSMSSLGDRPVDLVEVDRVDAQPLEARLAPRAGSSRASGCGRRRPARPLEQRRLREHVRAARRGPSSARPTTSSEWPKP